MQQRYGIFMVENVPFIDLFGISLLFNDICWSKICFRSHSEWFGVKCMETYQLEFGGEDWTRVCNVYNIHIVILCCFLYCHCHTNNLLSPPLSCLIFWYNVNLAVDLYIMPNCALINGPMEMLQNVMKYYFLPWLMKVFAFSCEFAVLEIWGFCVTEMLILIQ